MEEQGKLRAQESKVQKGVRRNGNLRFRCLSWSQGSGHCRTLPATGMKQACVGTWAPVLQRSSAAGTSEWYSHTAEGPGPQMTCQSEAETAPSS